MNGLSGILLALFLSVPSVVHAVDPADLLDPRQAFVLKVQPSANDMAVLEWEIADGYYLYRDRFRFTAITPGVRLGEPRFPPSLTKTDQFFGPMAIYRHRARVEIPVSPEAEGAIPRELELKTSAQGCADLGVCYPPQTQHVRVNLPPAAAKAEPPTVIAEAPPRETSSPSPPHSPRVLPLLDKPRAAQAEPELLDADAAFVLAVSAPDARTVTARWIIADGYYLYRDKLKLKLVEGDGWTIGEAIAPPGEATHDEFLGEQQVFRREATVTARLQGDSPTRDLKVQVAYQGCAEVLGVCYPPQTRIVPVTLATASLPPTGAIAGAPVGKMIASAGATPLDEAEQDRMARLLTENQFWATPAFFGFGLLLAFTPCVFPMIPILSSLIAGQGERLDQRRAFVLSLVYVLAMAVTYTFAGILAALLGQNVQAWFQNPWILTGFSALFVALALSMFGFYELQVPSRWQSRLSELSNRQQGGGYEGVAVMGVLSALIVGPCVAPPLIAALTVIAASGDVMLGGAALFALGLGMGAPLLVVGTSAGHWLPRAGHWMERIKSVFGVLLLALALWMLERVLPNVVVMLLWAVLLIVTATYMGALQSLSHGVPAWRVLIKGLGVVLLIYGVLLLVGVAAGGRDVWQPLRGVSLVAAGERPAAVLSFRPVPTLAAFKQAIVEARGRPVMLDFYADWCVSCQEMEKYTFTDPRVVALTRNALLLQADVTANDTDAQALLRHFGIIGPPAIVFFDSAGVEQRAYRVFGFMAADAFAAHLERALRSETVAKSH